MKKIVQLYQYSNPILNDAFNRTVVEFHLRKNKEGYKSCLLCGCNAGVGTTTIAISLAISMALSGCKTVLVDGDMRKDNRNQRLNETVGMGLSDYLHEEETLEKIIYNTNYEFLSYIPSGIKNLDTVELICSERMDSFINQLSENYDFVLIDMPSLNSAVDVNVIATKTDSVVLIVAQGKSSKRQLQVTKRQLETAGANIIGVIMNQITRSEYKKHIEKYDYFKQEKKEK
jgi:protein-tyrosine kinase